MSALVAAALIGVGAAQARQDQPEGAPLGQVEPGDAVEAYMQRLGLKRLQAADLAERLETAAPSDRAAIAGRLAKLYVTLLAEAKNPDERRKWEDLSHELLKSVPEADSSELRLSLIKTLHLQATEVLEKDRLRLATPEEVAEAERVLRSIKPQLEDISTKVNRRVEALEAMEEKGDTSEKLSDELRDGWRVRSQAFYYLGWTDYYLAYRTGKDEFASDALKAFGWLLNSRGGRYPSLDRVPKQLFKYEHVARAAAGCALCTALRGNYAGGLAWLDTLEESGDVPPAIRENLIAWRITILGEAKRWADLERFIRTVRNSDRTGGGEQVKPLGVLPARLLAVVTLDAGDSVAKDVTEPLAAIAMGDLISAGQIAHVLDLVQRYGTAPIGDKGFIRSYVRGIQQYEKARAAHKAAAGSASTETAGAQAAEEQPTQDPTAVEAYRIAAGLLRGAVDEPDATAFKAERCRASMLWGFSLYYSGELGAAGERFEATAQLAVTPEQSEEAMWLSVLSFDRAVEAGDTSQTKKRDEAAALFLQAHPDSPHAPKLLLRRAMTGVLDTDESVRILMGVEKGSPMYESARQHAARLLYQQYRRARGSERDFAAMRFASIAEETLAMDKKVAMEGEGKESDEAAERIVAHARQLLDALMGTQSPDPARAEAALDLLTSAATAHKIDCTPFQNELVFRRVQIALAKDDPNAAAALIEQLQAEGGQFAVAADQQMYKRALARREKAPGDADALREVVHYGSRLVKRMSEAPGAMQDPVVLSLHQTVAEAATELWRTQQDASMRDLAVQFDTSLLAAQPGNQGALHRLAGNAEAAGDKARALECWRTLLAGLAPATGDWYEARYESIRLLAALDPVRAREALKQHVVLYPDYAPEPWGSKMRQVERELGPAPSAAPPTPSGPPATAPSGGGGGR